MPENCVWFGALNTSARTVTERPSCFRGMDFMSDMSQLFTQVGTLNTEPPPAFPKQLRSCLVQLQGCGIANAFQLNVWVKSALLEAFPALSRKPALGSPTITDRTPSADPVKLGIGFRVVCPLNPGKSWPEVPWLCHVVTPEMDQWSVTQPSGLKWRRSEIPGTS